jgi:hypothetical protein
MTSTQLAKLFHDKYEEFAPFYGYITREDTREFNPDSNNGKLMIAVCKKVMELFGLPITEWDISEFDKISDADFRNENFMRNFIQRHLSDAYNQGYKDGHQEKIKTPACNKGKNKIGMKAMEKFLQADNVMILQIKK